jgi:hypothetical protein
MKKQNIIYWIIIMLMLVGCVWLFVSKTNKPKYDTQNTIDSLHSEIMGLQIDNGRYEIILNRLWEADSNFVMEHTKHIE